MEQSKKLTKVFELYKEATLRDTQLSAIRRINNCLPKRKEKKFDELTTGYMTRRFNANQAFQSAYRKLKLDEYVQFQEAIAS